MYVAARGLLSVMFICGSNKNKKSPCYSFGDHSRWGRDYLSVIHEWVFKSIIAVRFAHLPFLFLRFCSGKPGNASKQNARHSGQLLICGEGGTWTLDTALRPYDGLVTPHGVIDFSQFLKNYRVRMSKWRLSFSHLSIPLFLIFFSRTIASERVSQFIKPTNIQGIPCLLLSVEPELCLSKRRWRLFVWPQ